MEYGKQGCSGHFTGNYLDSLLVETRLIDSRIPDTSFELYGAKFASPVMAAAFSHSGSTGKGDLAAGAGNIGPAGLTESAGRCDAAIIAEGAQRAGAICWIDTEKEERLLEIADINAGTVRIIRPYADNNVIITLIKQAEECGALAVGVDISLVFDGRGGRGRCRGTDMAPKSMEEIREFVSASSIPFIVKGILSGRDAYKCVTAGAGGIVMSAAYGSGKYVISPLMALPDVLNAVNKQIPVFVDCGITSGQDAFKVLALGATAVFAGETLLESSDRTGAEVIFERISSMNDELKSLMAQTGCYDLSHMDKTVFRQI